MDLQRQPQNRPQPSRETSSLKPAHLIQGSRKPKPRRPSPAPQLRAWWASQQLFKTKREFAAAVGVSPSGLQDWFSGRCVPREKHWPRLYELAGLKCFSPEEQAERAEERREKKRRYHQRYYRAHGQEQLAKAKARWQQSPELRQRIRIREHNRHQQQLRRVTPEELSLLQDDPAQRFRLARPPLGQKVTILTTTVTDIDIVCLECGAILQSLNHSHLRYVHNLTPDAYREKWGYNRGSPLCSSRCSQRFSELSKRPGFEPPPAFKAGLYRFRRGQFRIRAAQRLEARLNRWLNGTREPGSTATRLRLLKITGLPVHTPKHRHEIQPFVDWCAAWLHSHPGTNLWDLAAYLEIGRDALKTHLAGRSFPNPKTGATLFAKTALSIFSPTAYAMRKSRQQERIKARACERRASEYVDAKRRAAILAGNKRAVCIWRCSGCGEEGSVGKKDEVCLRCRRATFGMPPDFADVFFQFMRWRLARTIKSSAQSRWLAAKNAAQVLKLASAHYSSPSEVTPSAWARLEREAHQEPWSAFGRFLRSEYFPGCTFTVGLWQLHSRLQRFIESCTERQGTIRLLRNFGLRILQALIQAGVDDPLGITPTVVIQHPPKYRNYRNGKSERWALGFFGRFLVAEALWSQEEGQEFEKLLARFYPSRARRQQGRRPTRFVPFVEQLANNCGLFPQEIRALRVSQVEQEGIRLDKSRFIRFGEDPHQVSRHAVDEWVAKANPKDYVFYQRKPRDYHKPTSLQWFLQKGYGVKIREGSVRIAHFRRDFRRAANLRRLHLHWHHFHRLSEDQSRDLLKSFLARASTFVVPEPYMPVLLCVSRLLPAVPVTEEGGELCSFTWPLMFNRYTVKVTWPVSFARELQNRRRGEKVARWLYKLALKCWSEQWRLRGRAPTRDYDRDLLRKLSLTRALVHDTDTGASWSGALIRMCSRVVFGGRYHVIRARRERYLSLPLFDELEGGTPNGRCSICGHLEQEAIDSELRMALTVEGRNKGFAHIGRKYKLDYRELIWHAGRLTRRVHYRWKKRARYRSEHLPSHVGSAAPATTLRCPVDFVDRIARLTPTALILYTLLLLKGRLANGQKFDISPNWVEQQVGLSLSEFEFSVELRHLREEKFVSHFEKAPGGFWIFLPSTHEKDLPRPTISPF